MGGQVFVWWLVAVCNWGGCAFGAIPLPLRGTPEGVDVLLYNSLLVLVYKGYY